MSKVIDCRAIRDKEIAKLKEMDLSNCNAVFIQVGYDQASNIYVRNKMSLCNELGIQVRHFVVAPKTTERELLAVINSFNKNEKIHGIMVQLPLPDHIDENAVINAIVPGKDIDGFTHANKGKLMVGDSDAIIPCTPKGILTILEHENIDLRGKNVVIVGRSNIVGKPLAQLMINKGATVTVCNSSTDKERLKRLIAESDIFVSAIGSANYFNQDFFNGCDLGRVVAIDVGINRDENNKLCGDIDKGLYDYFKAITSVPGGVGVMTVLEVIRNLIKCYGR